jgi:hypothetical protein
VAEGDADVWLTIAAVFYPAISKPRSVRSCFVGDSDVPLIALWRSTPDAVSQFNIEQVVATSGDGSLRDGSLCLDELREYLKSVSSDKLFEYIDGCLIRAFNKSGAVLQDIVNELGRRLDYEVENGLYQGRPGAIGFDGIWTAPDGHALVVEREALISSQRMTRESSILIVVGRSDTGDIEAQVRGSRHAWDVRLISIDALTKLVALKETADEEETVAKIRSLLTPFEYTRLDNIIEVMFAAAKDVESAVELERGEEVGFQLWQIKHDVKQEHTDRNIINQARLRILEALGKREGAAFIAKSRALYWNADNTIRVSCSLSKRHQRGTYWYAYHPHWDEFLAAGERAYCIWGCADRDLAYVLPRRVMLGLLEELYVTHRQESGKRYWHVELEPSDAGEMYFLVRKSGRRIPIDEFRINF